MTDLEEKIKEDIEHAARLLSRAQSGLRDLGLAGELPDAVRQAIGKLKSVGVNI